MSIWRSALWFTLVGPPIGYGLYACILAASMAWRGLPHYAPDPFEFGLSVILFDLLLYASFGLVAAYVIGGPAAAAAGATMAYTANQGCTTFWTIVATVLVGVAIGVSTVYTVDQLVLPHPHSDPAPPLGPMVWTAMGAITAMSATACTLLYGRRYRLKQSGSRRRIKHPSI